MSSLVAASWGEVVGTTWTMSTLAPGAVGKGVTDATPGSLRSLPVNAASAAVSAGDFTSATSCNGPLKPGPKPFAIKSYALRVELPEGSLPESEDPSRSERTGSINTSMTTIAPTANTLGRLATSVDQRAQNPLACGSCGPSTASRRRSLRPSTRGPRKPSSAGRNVVAAATVKTDQRSGKRQLIEEAETKHEQSQQRDADGPAGEQDRTAGCVQGSDGGFLWCETAQDTRAMPGDDEQCVVDTDAKADQGGERRPDRSDAHHVGEQSHGQQSAAQGHHGGEQWKGHREQRPERDEQDDSGGDHADQRAVGGWGLLDLLDRVAAQLDVEAGRASRLRQVDDSLYVGLGQCLCHLGEGYVRECRASVLTQLGSASRGVRAGGRGHRRRLGHPVEHRGNLGLDGRVVDAPAPDVDDDRVGVASLGGEARAQQSQCLARLGARQREAIGVCGADA